MKRRTVLMAGAALVITELDSRDLGACDGRDDLAGPPALEKLVARIGRNHGHAFPITLADVMAGGGEEIRPLGDVGAPARDHGHGG